MNHDDTIKRCEECGKEYIKRIECYPSNVDEKRESYYVCPWCNHVIEKVYLRGNEEIYTYKCEG